MAQLNVVIEDSFFREEKGANFPGHMFIEIKNQTGVDDISIGAAKGGSGDDVSNVRYNDTELSQIDESRDHIITFDITDKQAQNIRDWVKQNEKNIDYSIGYNCVDFTYEMLKVGGIPVDESDKDFWSGNNVDEIEEAKARYEN